MQEDWKNIEQQLRQRGYRRAYWFKAGIALLWVLSITIGVGLAAMFRH